MGRIATILKSTVLPGLMAFLVVGMKKEAAAPDFLLLNGKVFTSDPSNWYTEAVAISKDRITAIGNNAAIKAMAGPATKIIDLGGRTVIPGINDAHDHIGFGTPRARHIQFRADMMHGPSLQTVLDSLSLITRDLPKGTLITGSLGVDLLEDPKARREAFDQVSPDHPLILQAPWGHGTLLNSQAMQWMGISESSADPMGGHYERDPATGKLTGALIEYAEFFTSKFLYSQLSEAEQIAGAKEYGATALQLGITSVQNMATSLNLDQMYRLLEQARLPQRIRIIRFPETSPKAREIYPWTTNYPSSSFLYVSGMKWILDGTPVERGSYMLEAYKDKPGWKGALNFHPDTISTIIAEGWRSKEQLMLHITGDALPELVMDKMESMGSEADWLKKRLRFEHADGFPGKAVTRARSMGIVPVVNPSHFMLADIIQQRIGPERAASYQPFRSLLAAGIPVAIGSDGPNNPYLNIMFATIHANNPGEAVTREQAVIAYTYGSAYAEFMENEKGMIRKGYLADLAVLSQDIFTIPTQALPRTTAVMTIIDGKIVHDQITAKNNEP
ncbi:amidohydrolase [Flavihumibacter rivuli]|uniref:amidohydrolase n=1 Tax=Flavihumibacter rivuli TaxID=2838156 RepID=UPI001BDE2E35|nr:amidohydrolase [Flavihumibacter rivuli]ULQ57009.1 amidohydrolase [Flavihumibacter rivuli]